MLNILVLLGGSSLYFDREEYPFPKPLIEIDGISMIEHVINNLNSINEEKRFIFVVKKEDCIKYHLDSVLNLLTDNQCRIIKLDADTQGAVCSSLMAIDYINNDDKLIVCNGDQVIEADFNQVLGQFASNNLDAGVICFESVHPKWSFARLDENGKIIETVEKNPISKNAIAGFYFYKKGSFFVEAAKKTIEKDANVNGLYFISSTYNELVLENKNLEIFRIKPSQYLSFYSPKKIEEYEREKLKCR